MITFNGVSSTVYGDILSVTRVARSLYPGSNPRTLRVPARDGVHYFGRDTREQTISFRLALRSTSASARRAAIRDIVDWLDTDDVATLTVTDEPTLRYEAVLVDAVNVDEFADLGMTDVTFMIPDGCAYSDTASTVGPQQEIQTLFLGGASGGTYLLGQVDGLSLPWTEYSTETWASASAL